MDKRRQLFSPRQHHQQTQSRLVVAGFLILLGVGGGLMWVLYGRTAAVATVACLLVGAGLFGLLWLVLALLERWVKKE